METAITCYLQFNQLIFNLKCNCVAKKKPVGDIFGFRSRMNQDLRDSRMRVSTCKFPIHVYNCGSKSECLNESFFGINVMMKLKNSNQLETSVTKKVICHS